MKTIGLIGGMSWESSAEYYRLLNEGVRAVSGRPHPRAASFGRSILRRSSGCSMWGTGIGCRA